MTQYSWRTPALLTVFWILVTVWASAPSDAQNCSVATLPATSAPIMTLDAHTTVLGTFDAGTTLLTATGASSTKVSMATGIAAGGGFFGTSSLAVPNTASVAIYPSGVFPSARGTLEMWVRPSSTSSTSGQQATLFALRGAASLDGDLAADLVFGETTPDVTAATSRILFDGDLGGAIHAPLTFTSYAPRGIAVGDLSGDGIADLAVSQNFGNLLPNPVSPVPGEVHIWFGPFAEGGALGAPNRIIEVSRPQGLVLADLDRNGTLDLVIASYDPNTEAIVGYSNDGAANFKRLKFELGEIVPGEAIAVGDVDHDGVLDVLYASFDSVKPSRVCLGRSPSIGVYELGGPSGVNFGLRPSALGASLADVNSDGWLDAVLALPYEGTGAVVIHLNRGDGTFDATPDVTLPTTKPFTLNATRDLDQDGHLDIVVANWRQGLVTNPVSTVWYGPFTGAQPSSRGFRVDDAVAQCIGDLDGNGTDDLVFHSSTATHSPAFLLDWNGIPTGGFDTTGVALPSSTFPSQPTVGNPSGEGAGMALAFSGTSTYGSVHVEPSSFDLRYQAGVLRFSVRSKAGRTHEAALPFPPANDPYAVNGFHHIQAEWDAAAGRVELRIGHPQFGTIATTQSPPFVVGTVAPVMRIGTDADNQSRASGWFLDGFRISSVRRSTLDLDQDGIQDDFDVCRYAADPLQLDANDDGIGDACSDCANDLGFGGPGSLTVDVCGQSLAGASYGALVIRCGPKFAPTLLVASANLAPQPFFGGTLVPAVPFTSLRLALDAEGSLVVPYGGPGFALDVFAQAIAIDVAQPLGVALSNAVKIQVP